MTRLIIPSLFAILALVVPTTASAATPNVGEHIHVAISNHPVDGKPIARGPYTFNVTITAHDTVARITSVRVADGGTVKVTKAISLGPCADCSVTVPFTVDFSSWTVGRHELRWTANMPAITGHGRLYQSTGWQVCIAACTPNPGGRATPFIEARGWQGGQYSNVRILTHLRLLNPGATFRVQAANTATTGACYLNPDFHSLSHGTLIGSFGTSVTTLTIPASASPGDRLVCVAHQGTRAGVQRVNVQPAGSDPATAVMESQLWWRATGLVIP